MDAPFGGGTDPVPYIAAAYVIGAVLFVGFYLTLIAQRRRLRQLLAAVRR